MIIRNFYDDPLAQASYLVGCAATGQAIVIDPLRDIRPYLQTAERLGLQIVAVTETHIHADFLSGSRELSAKTGATMYLSDEGDALWKYEFAREADSILMKDGHVIKIGNLTLRAIHTPGHTPEHMSFLLTDHPMSEQPHSLFTGDFLFAGDVGRPDLLERAANFIGTMEKGARVLFTSLQLLRQFDDALLIWPAHGAGSACGKSLGGSPVTSLGYERRTNWALQISDEEKFVDEVLAGQPEPPIYFKEMKRLNKVGPTVLGEMPKVTALKEPVGRLIDVRNLDSIRANYQPGTLAIPEGPGLTNWAGWLLAYDEPVTLITETQTAADAVARDMATIGLDVVAGWIPPSPNGSPLPQSACAALPSDAYVLDVRGINEYRSEHLINSIHIPLGYLASRLDEIPRDKPVFVHCASGRRSLTAATLLRTAGFNDVTEIEGGLARVSDVCPGLVFVEA